MKTETLTTYALAGIGAVEGVWEYWVKPKLTVRPELTAKRAWCAIGLGVLAYEMAAPPGELLSEGVDASLGKHPILTRAAIGVTALHLMNLLPEKLDPFHRLTEAVR